MKKLVKKLLFLSFLLTSFQLVAQNTLTGRVIDDLGKSMPGATVLLKGTMEGTTTDNQGMFSLRVSQNQGVLVVSFIGYTSTEVSFNVSQKTNLGTIQLSSDMQSLSDVVVVGSGVIDLSEDRITPIASTVVSKLEIQSKAVGNVEFPAIMKSTPNVYVTNRAGGFGDSQMFLRGFDQSNTAFLLNGQPINGMEDGNMYWSNWAGMSDIANAIDIQRGLGSSKLAISSVGGTVNIVTKATEKEKGGLVRFIGGNGSYMKGTVAYNTGKLDNGWGLSILLDYWQADRKWADGTKGQGQNYFISFGKQVENHNFNFLLFGAPQWHDQNFSKSIELYDEYGLRYNDNWGYNDGEYMTWRRNYYHKPVMNLNWDWLISNKSSLSTVLYASFGRGGGTGPYGSSSQYRIFDDNRQIDFDVVQDNNEAIDGGIGTYGTAAALRASANNHQWYGAVTNFEYDTESNLVFNVGADLRFYNGDHFRQLVDKMGLDGWEDAYGRYDAALDNNGEYIVTNTYAANPWASLTNFAPEEDRIAYDNSEWINYQGVFGQAEYAANDLSAFFQGAVSNQSYQKEERFSADHTRSDVLNRFGYNAKVGASYTVAGNHTVFANAGYYSRQPFLDNIFEYGTIEKRSMEVENEQITGLEGGYKVKLGLRSSANLNVYYTKWANRFLGTSTEDYVPTSGGDPIADAGIRMSNIGQVHSGLELEAKTWITRSWKIKGFFTYGDWKYEGSTPVEVIDYDQNNAVVDQFNVDLNGAMVGEAPQITAGVSTEYNLGGFKIWLDMNYYDKLYGFVDVEDMAIASFEGTTYESEKLDAYMLFDAGASYSFYFDSGDALKLRANVYNLFNNEYISRKDSYGYFYGNGTTWNVGLSYEF